VDGVDLEVREGETVGLVGESGCGKSTLGETLLQLQDITAGSVQFRGEALTSMDASARQAFRSECQIIFQDPEASLNPRKTINEIVARPLKLFTNLDAAERSSRIRELLQQVNLSTDIDTKYPHELSGGQQQRVALARAFAANPSLIILDEPVSSLDVSVQASILNLLEELQADYGTSYLLISHDLGVINNICDRVSIMYLGEIVESGSVNDVFEPPHHPYTRALLSSIPSLNPDKQKNQLHLEGDVPSARNPPSGCSFHTRCPQKIGDICESDAPDLERVEGASESHCISCHLDSAEMSKDTEEL
jgi:peptide/nickel transport system ATP-binding protein